MSSESDGLTDKHRMLFGSGFVFGVTFMLVVLAVVAARVAAISDLRLTTDVVVTITAGTFFVSVIGVVLYFLAFPGNRVQLPVGSYLDPEGRNRPTGGETDETEESAER